MAKNSWFSGGKNKLNSRYSYSAMPQGLMPSFDIRQPAPSTRPTFNFGNRPGSTGFQGWSGMQNTMPRPNTREGYGPMSATDLVRRNPEAFGTPKGSDIQGNTPITRRVTYGDPVSGPQTNITLGSGGGLGRQAVTGGGAMPKGTMDIGNRNAGWENWLKNQSGFDPNAAIPGRKSPEYDFGETSPDTRGTFRFPDKPVGEPPPEETPPVADTEPGPYQLGYYEQQAVQPAMGGLRAYAAGESPVDRRIANLYLGYLRAGNEAERAAAAQEMAQLGVSPQAAAARMAMLGQRQGSQEAQTAGELAVSSQERAMRAAQQLGQLGMQGARLEQGKYEFEEDLTERQRQFNKELALSRERHEEDIRQFNETQERLRENDANRELWNRYDAAIEAGDWEGAAAIYEQISGNPIDMSTLKEAEQRNLRNELMPQVKQRINEAMAAGKGFEEIAQDQTTREWLADALDVGINDDRIDTELRDMYDAELANDYPKAKENFAQNIAEAAEKGWTIDEVLADEMTWRHAGYSMQLDPYDAANSDAIEEKIRREYVEANKSPIDDMVDFIETDMASMYADTPGMRGDVRQVVTDMYLSNKVTWENGEMVIKEDAFWPWEDPEKMFNYVDWEGNDLAFNENGDLTPESQQQLQQVAYTTPEGQSITQQQAIDKWKSLDNTTRSKYLNDDGTINQRSFLESSDGFGVAQGPGENTIHTSPGYWDEYIISPKGATQTAIFSGAGDEPGVLEQLLNADMGQENEDEETDMTVFGYYDVYGNKRQARLDSPKMLYVWLQFREAFGPDLTPSQFTALWNSGEGWVVDDNHMVKNFDPQWREQNDLPEAGTTPSSYRLSSSLLATLSPLQVGVTTVEEGEDVEGKPEYERVPPRYAGETVITSPLEADETVLGTDETVLESTEITGEGGQERAPGEEAPDNTKRTVEVDRGSMRRAADKVFG